MNFSDLFDESNASASAPVSKPARSETTNRALVNVQKSIQLLDDAVGSVGPILRTRTPRHGSSFRRDTGNYPLQAVSSRSALEQSSFLHGDSRTGQSFLQPNKSGDASLYALATPGKSMMSGLDYSLNMTTATNMTLLQDDPHIVASTGLFRDFLTCIRNRPSEHQIFDLVRDYENVLADQTKLLRRMVKMTTPGKTKFSNTAHMLRELEKERWTWTLIKSLYQDRIDALLKQEENMLIDEEPANYKSDKTLVNELYERDDVTRQAQIVVDWLERIAEEGFEDYRDQVEFFQDKSGAWENSLHTLKQRAKGLPTQSQRQIVTELDPDAPLRQKMPLDDLDLADENRLLHFLFALIRSGQLEEAQRLCTRCGQSWRAATLEGWRLHHDPNYQQLGVDGDIRNVEGNAYRDLWKNICWKLANDERVDKHERAIYASLSGNLRPLLNVSRTWEDHLWAYFKTMVDQRVEEHIRLNTTSSRAMEPLPAEASKTFDHEAVFSEIDASPQDLIRSQNQDPYNQIIKYVILNDVQELTKKMHKWVSESNEAATPQFKRFLAHLVLFFRNVGIETPDELSLEILEAYVQILIELKQNELVASYVASLTQPLQVQWYARFLEGITDKDERESCLSLADDAGLDLACITKSVVENIRNRKSETDSDDNVLGQVTSTEDKEKIEAIDWLVFDPSQRAEAIRQGNAVMRAFLAVKKLAAAREVFLKIPHGSIELVHRNWQMQAGSSELPPEDANAIHEFLCIQAYLDAHDSFNDWFQHFHHTRPAEPEKKDQASTFTERVAQEHRMKQYNIDLERWKNSLEIQTKTTVERIYNVLLFVEGGWMIDIHQLSESDQCRQQQMESLRKLCLPQLCYLLVRVQTESGQFSQCLQLVDVIAAESHKLYQVFTKDEMRRLLAMFKDSSVALLDNDKDPLGYDITG